MAKPEWGMKRTCTTCGARFYDMNRDPILCPKCGAENEKEVVTKVKRAGRGSRADAPKKAAVAEVPEDEEVEDDLLESDGDDDDDSLMEDASDLGEDDDDMAEVIEHIEPGDEET